MSVCAGQGPMERRGDGVDAPLPGTAITVPIESPRPWHRFSVISRYVRSTGSGTYGLSGETTVTNESTYMYIYTSGSLCVTYERYRPAM
jgi:hypothetical protein